MVCSVTVEFETARAGAREEAADAAGGRVVGAGDAGGSAAAGVGVGAGAFAIVVTATGGADGLMASSILTRAVACLASALLGKRVARVFNRRRAVSRSTGSPN